MTTGTAGKQAVVVVAVLLADSGVPWTVLRATRFHALVAQLFDLPAWAIGLHDLRRPSRGALQPPVCCVIAATTRSHSCGGGIS